MDRTRYAHDDGKMTGMRYNRYGDDFLIDKIRPEELGEELVNVGELRADEEGQIFDDSEHSLQEDPTTPEIAVDEVLSNLLICYFVTRRIINQPFTANGEILRV